MNQMKQTPTNALPKRRYAKPVLKQIGNIKNLTLKAGSIADGFGLAFP